MSIKKKRNLIWVAVMGGLLAWTIYNVLRDQTPGQLAHALVSADWRFLLIGVALMAAFVAFEARSSHLILRALGTPQPYRRCYLYSSTGFFFSNITPSATGGQPAQIYYMNRDGVPVAHGAIDMLLVTIGFLQAIIATIGDLVLGIQCEHPLLFILAGIFCSFVYINIIYALAVAFRHIGKAIAVILVIVQIPGASGLYPIEMMPNFFRELHPWLPFTYGINAMRGPIAGLYANHYWLDMLHLFWYLPAALFVGLVVRRYAMNLNALFDHRLGGTDLMITEHNSMVNEQVSLNSVFRTVSDSKELRDIIAHRAHRFFARYPKMIVAGLTLLTVLRSYSWCCCSSPKSKIAMLTSWILSIILIDAYLIVVEYARETYAMQLGVSAMSADEFRNVMLNGYAWRRFHGHGRHEAAMGSNPDIGETTERLTPFSDQAAEPTAHTAQFEQSGQSGQSGQGGAR